MKIILNVLFYSLFCSWLIQATAHDGFNYLRVNLVMLIAAPADYDQRKVKLKALYCDVAEYERVGLFLTLDDCRTANFENAIQLDFESAFEIPDGLSSNTFVTFSGEFKSWQGLVALDTPFRWGVLKVHYIDLY